MKKIYSTIAVLAISSLALFSSCKKDDGDPTPDTPVTPEATVTLNENTNTTGTETLYVKRDKTSAIVQVNGISKTTTDLKRIYVYKKTTTTAAAGAYVTYNGSGFKQDGASNYYYDIPNDQKNNVSLTLTLTLNSLSTVSDEYYFVFTNGNNFGGPATSTGVLLGPAKIFIVYGLLNETTGHRLNNYQGPNSGAFSLSTLTNKAASDPETGKDMIDADKNTATWDKSFSSGTSGTLFAKLPANFDYANATDISIKAAYTLANNENDTRAAVAVGDIYVANLSGLGTNYVLIKITSISDETNGTGPGNNNEYMEFSVKK